ncbi:MAG: hypothetical protein AB7F96_13345 [Beijerinckiaceae bacterium]
MAENASGARPSLLTLVMRVLLVALPLLTGLGFGYLHLAWRKQFREQETISQLGASVIANIDSLQMIKSGNGERCLAIFRYEEPGKGAVVRRQIFMPSADYCSSHKANENVKAWIVPGDARIFVLDEQRISPWWQWLSLALFVLLCGIAIIMLRSMLGLRRTPVRRGK